MPCKYGSKIVYPGSYTEGKKAHSKHKKKAKGMKISYSELMRKGADVYQKPTDI